MSRLSTAAIATINLYQKTVSPDHGNLAAPYVVGNCRFYPSCSEYMKEAIPHFGFWKGVYKGVRRVLRCNPFCKGGFDPIHTS